MFLFIHLSPMTSMTISVYSLGVSVAAGRADSSGMKFYHPMYSKKVDEIV